MSDKSDEKPDDPAEAKAESAVPGILSLLFGGLPAVVMARGLLAEQENVVCEDCENWCCLGEDLELISVVGQCALGAGNQPACGPLWPGCRGFKHRLGTPGPLKRAQEKQAKQMQGALGGWG